MLVRSQIKFRLSKNEDWVAAAAILAMFTLEENNEQITSKISCDGQTTLRDAVFDAIGH